MANVDFAGACLHALSPSPHHTTARLSAPVSQPLIATWSCNSRPAISRLDFAGVCAHRGAPQALFTTALTLPVILVLNAMFSHLRSPHERAIAGEFTSKSEDADYDCFIIEKV